jgi:hypothetical protein
LKGGSRRASIEPHDALVAPCDDTPLGSRNQLGKLCLRFVDGELHGESNLPKMTRFGNGFVRSTLDCVQPAAALGPCGLPLPRQPRPALHRASSSATSSLRLTAGCLGESGSRLHAVQGTRSPNPAITQIGDAPHLSGPGRRDYACPSWSRFVPEQNGSHPDLPPADPKPGNP